MCTYGFESTFLSRHLMTVFPLESRGSSRLATKNRDASKKEEAVCAIRSASKNVALSGTNEIVPFRNRSAVFALVYDINYEFATCCLRG